MKRLVAALPLAACLGLAGAAFGATEAEWAAFRALAPYWRKAGIKSAPRKQERRKEPREGAEML